MPAEGAALWAAQPHGNRGGDGAQLSCEAGCHPVAQAAGGSQRLCILQQGPRIRTSFMRAFAVLGEETNGRALIWEGGREGVQQRLMHLLPEGSLTTVLPKAPCTPPWPTHTLQAPQRTLCWGGICSGVQCHWLWSDLKPRTCTSGSVFSPLSKSPSCSHLADPWWAPVRRHHTPLRLDTRRVPSQPAPGSLALKTWSCLPPVSP